MAIGCVNRPDPSKDWARGERLILARIQSTMNFHGSDFFNRHHLDVARDLIGCSLDWDGCSGIIVETEGYGAAGDEACHLSFRRSARAFFAAHPPGTVYAYINYGIYWLLNVLAEDGIVLIRALQPTSGLDTMHSRRGAGKREIDLCSGPGKLGVAIALGADDHGTPLVGLDHRGIAPRDGSAKPEIQRDVRVGITRAAELPWRFLLAGNPHVSVAAGKVKKS